MLLARHYPVRSQLAGGGGPCGQRLLPLRPRAPPRSLVQRTAAYARNEKRAAKPPPSLAEVEKLIRTGLRQGYQGIMRRTWKMQALVNLQGQDAREVRFGTNDFTKHFGRLLEVPCPALHETLGANVEVMQLCEALVNVPELKISRVHVGGSAGRRTNVSESFDMDIVAYVISVNGKPVELGDWCDNAEWHTKLRLRVMDHLREAGWTVKFDTTRYALQLKKGDLDFDVLVMPELAADAEDPVREQHKALMASVYGNPERARYSVLRQRADSPALTEFAEGQPDTVKSVARLVKAWVKLGLAQHLKRWDDARIPSCALEVMVYAAYEELKEQVGANAVRGDALFLRTLKVIQQAVNEERLVMVDAGEWGYPLDVGMCCGPHNWLDGDPRHAVRVIHPTDPTCNLAMVQEGRGVPDWTGLAQHAATLEYDMLHYTLAELLRMSTLAPILEMLYAQNPLVPDNLRASPMPGQHRRERRRRGRKPK